MSAHPCCVATACAGVCAQVGQLAVDSHKRRTLIERGLLEPVATLAMDAAHPSTRAAAAVALAALVATREDARQALTVGFHPPCAQLPLLTALVRAEARKGEEAAAAAAALAALARADVACAGYVAEHRGLPRVVSMLHAAGRFALRPSRVSRGALYAVTASCGVQARVDHSARASLPVWRTSTSESTPAGMRLVSVC